MSEPTPEGRTEGRTLPRAKKPLATAVREGPPVQGVSDRDRTGDLQGHNLAL
jgi:hypothetical protein